MLKTLYNRLNKALDKHGAYFSFTNYTRDDNKGEFPRHGRIAVSSYRVSDSIRLEWVLGDLDLGFSVRSVPQEARAGVSFSVPGLSLYFTLESYRKLGDVTKRIGHRVLRFATHDGAFWWETPLADPDGGPCDEPWYVRGDFHFVDALLGKTETKTIKTEGPTRVEVHMPEGVYTGTCEIERRLIGRPRWFSAPQTIARIGLDAPHGIPFPGKGENSYDCEDDAMYMFSTEARSPADAVGQLVGRVLHLRWSRGGKSWRPSPSSSNDGGAQGNGDEEPNIPTSTVPPSGTFTASTIVPLPSLVLN